MGHAPLCSTALKEDCENADSSFGWKRQSVYHVGFGIDGQRLQTSRRRCAATAGAISSSASGGPTDSNFASVSHGRAKRAVGNAQLVFHECDVATACAG